MGWLFAVWLKQAISFARQFLWVLIMSMLYCAYAYGRMVEAWSRFDKSAAKVEANMNEARVLCDKASSQIESLQTAIKSTSEGLTWKN
jgi:hypothetical protein